MNDSDVLLNLSDASYREVEAATAEASSTANTPGHWLSVTETATLLGVSARAVQKRCVAGKIVARRVTTPQGVVWKIDANQLSRTCEPTSRSDESANAVTARYVEHLENEVEHLRSQIEAQRAEYLATIEVERRESALTIATLRAAINAMTQSLPIAKDDSKSER